MQLLIGLGTAIGVAWLAYRAGSLDRSGAYAAVLVGALTFGLGGWQFAALLLAFFGTSSWLTHTLSRKKARMVTESAGGPRRDSGQVLGNGAWPALFATLHALMPGADWPWLGFAAALAGVNADTWATEIGVLNHRPPGLITHLTRRVPPGTSGAVSLLGSLAALAGSLFIAAAAAMLAPSLHASQAPKIGIIIAVGGLLGAFFDSLLGATIQAMYFCPQDLVQTEKHPRHQCGASTVRVRGWGWLSNDWVNFGCAAFAAGAAISSINAGQPFYLEAWVADRRVSPLGVAAAYLDVTYPSVLALVAGSVANGADFPHFVAGQTATA